MVWNESVFTDGSEPWIEETAEFDTSFRLIHGIGMLDFEDTHRLSRASNSVSRCSVRLKQRRQKPTQKALAFA